MRTPKRGDTVNLTVCIGEDEWTVKAQLEHDGVNIEEMTGPGGAVVDCFNFDKSFTKQDRDRIEQAVIDCYYDYDADSAFDRAVDRGIEMRKARLEGGRD